MIMTAAPSGSGTTADLARAALDRAVDLLLSRQQQDGRWQDQPEASVTAVAVGPLLVEFLRGHRPGSADAAARWIRSSQRPDGGWAEFPGGTADPGATDLAAATAAYVALRAAGDPPDAYHMALAAGWIRDAGGLAAAGLVTQAWLAVLGLRPWDEQLLIPPQIVFRLGRMPLGGPGSESCADGPVTPLVAIQLAVISSLRQASVGSFDLSELEPPDGGGRPILARSVLVNPGRPGLTSASRRMLTARRRNRAASAPVMASPAAALRACFGRRNGAASVPVLVSRAAALRACAGWLLARQDADGSWDQQLMPSAFALVALRQLGYPAEHPALARGMSWLDRSLAWTLAPPGPVAADRAWACAVPDTALAMTALADAGLAADHPALTKAASWLISQQIRGPGDRPGGGTRTVQAGWAGRSGGACRPDVPATAAALTALRRIGRPVQLRASGSAHTGRPAGCEPLDAVARAGTWLSAAQSGAGAWSAAETGGQGWLAGQLPVAVAASAGPPSAAATAAAVGALSAAGPAGSTAVRRGVVWLLQRQASDGSWPGGRGPGSADVTSAVVQALIAAGVGPGKQPVRRAVGWLVAGQNGDGGWSDRPGRTGTGGTDHGSTAVATAGAVLALIAAGGADAARSTELGVLWLIRGQHADGDWDESPQAGPVPAEGSRPQLSRLCCPVRAIGQYLSTSAEPTAGRYPGASAEPAAGLASLD